MKKLIALLLCLVMCVPLFAACGGNDEPADTTASAEQPQTTDAPNTDAVTTNPNDTDNETTEPEQTTEKEWLPEMQVNDWDGYTFKISYYKTDNAQTDFICNDVVTGNVLNDQVYARNNAVEQMLNINIHTDAQTSQSQYGNILQNQYNAGWTEGDYNMVTFHRDVIKLSIKGILYDLATYDNVNLYNPYWDQAYVDTMMMNDSLYSVVGDYSVKANLFVSSICFNKDLFREEGLDEPYNAVKTYDWTVDMLLDYMEGFATDLDNDGFDQSKDRFGISGWETESAFGIFYGSGFTYCKNDGETLSIDYDRELLDDVIESALNVWAKNGSYILSGSSDQHSMPFEIFSSGRALFCDIVLYKIGTFFSDMESDYGILPEPMFSEDQGKYYGYTGYAIPLLVIPATDPNPERTGNIIEVICAASNDIVIPKMFEIVTKIQNTRDEESADMIDIIIRNKVYDAAHWLNLSGYSALIRNIIGEGNNVSSSYLNMYATIADNELKAFVEAYQSMNK